MRINKKEVYRKERSKNIRYKSAGETSEQD